MSAVESSAERTQAAVSWFAARGLGTIRVHRPTKIPSTTPLGACSCGKPYRIDPATGKPDQSDGLCSSPGKHPVDRDWNRGRLVDEGGWDEPWNVGLLCGPDHSLMVLDVDPKNGGHVTWARLAEALPWVQETFSYWTSRAPSGERGFHLLFRPVGDDAWSALAAAPTSVSGVDVKDSGMVVSVPSLHASGDRYEFRTGDLGIRELDAQGAGHLSAALSDLLPAGETGVGRILSDGPPATQELRRWLLGYDVGYLDEGERNNGMLPLVGAAVRMAVDGWDGAASRQELESELRALEQDHQGVPYGLMTLAIAINDSVCRPPLGREELGQMLHNVYRAELTKQLQALDGVSGMSNDAAERTRTSRQRWDEDFGRRFGRAR